MSSSTDPLEQLPREVVLQICLASSIRSLTRLEAVSKSWQNFLQVHSEYLWSHKSAQLERITAGEASARPSLKLSRPMASDGTTHSQKEELQRVVRGKWSCDKDAWTGIDTWKEYCRREYLLHANLNSPEAEMYDRNINTHQVIVWRMRPDYDNRLLVCTAHNGGLWVYDLDDGSLLWNLSREDVDPHAHLEHSQGTLAFNPGDGETIEIWRLAELVRPGRDTNVRGQYVPVARLPHDKELRGWHLLFPTLCVVSNQGQAWIYDVSTDPPQLKTTINLEYGARGHLEQDETTVMFCMKEKGYHVYDKSTGHKLGELNPAAWNFYQSGSASHNVFHIIHPDPAPSALLGACQFQDPAIPASGSNVVADLRPGPLNENSPRLYQKPIEEEEWGAGMVSGPYMVGVSRGGRVVIISDWKAVLKDPSKAKDYAAIVECQADSGSHYDLGGWLTLGGAHNNQRAAWEVRDRVYLFPLPAPQTLPRPTQYWSTSSNQNALDLDETLSTSQAQPIHAITSTSDSQIEMPISFMQLTEDHLLTTFASIRLRPARDIRSEGGRHRAPNIYIGKGPRIVNFAPWVNAKVKQQAAAVAAASDSEEDDARAMIHGGFLAGDDGDFFDSDDEDEEDEDEEFTDAQVEQLIAAQQHLDDDEDEWVD